MWRGHAYQGIPDSFNGFDQILSIIVLLLYHYGQALSFSLLFFCLTPDKLFLFLVGLQEDFINDLEKVS